MPTIAFDLTFNPIDRAAAVFDLAREIAALAAAALRCALVVPLIRGIVFAAVVPLAPIFPVVKIGLLGATARALVDGWIVAFCAAPISTTPRKETTNNRRTKERPNRDGAEILRFSNITYLIPRPANLIGPVLVILLVWHGATVAE